MNDNILSIRTLVDRFFEGETTLAEEQQLYAFFGDDRQLPPDLEKLRPLFQDLAAVRCVAAPPQQKSQTSRRWHWAVAAAVATLLVGGALTLYHNHTSGEEEYVAYIYGQRTTDRATVLGEMQKTMATLASTDANDVVEEQLRTMFSH